MKVSSKLKGSMWGESGGGRKEVIRAWKGILDGFGWRRDVWGGLVAGGRVSG